MESFWQLGDELRGQTQSRASEDHKWSTVATKLAEQTRMKGERFNNLDLSKAGGYSDKFSFQDNNNNMLNLGGKYGKASMQSNVYNMKVNKYNGNVVANKELSNNSNDNNAVDKRFKTLPASETLPSCVLKGDRLLRQGARRTVAMVPVPQSSKASPSSSRRSPWCAIGLNISALVQRRAFPLKHYFDGTLKTSWNSITTLSTI